MKTAIAMRLGALPKSYEDLVRTQKTRTANSPTTPSPAHTQETGCALGLATSIEAPLDCESAPSAGERVDACVDMLLNGASVLF